jgi:hypothetical protein
MGQNSDNSAGAESAGPNGDKPEAQASHLPVVWSPKLDAGAAANEAPNLGAGEDVSPPHDEAATGAPEQPAAASTQSSRFVLLAASVAIAAGLGSFLGSLTASGIAQLVPTDATRAHTADAGSVVQAMKAQLAELSTIKSSLDGATRGANAQFAKIADRLDRVERAEADPATKLAQIADTVDRLDKRSAASPDITGSITPSAPQSSDAKETDKVLEDWIVQDVRRGRAMVENKYGSVFFVGPGSSLPRLGSVETVKRQDGQWIVVTEHGLITSSGR